MFLSDILTGFYLLYHYKLYYYNYATILLYPDHIMCRGNDLNYKYNVYC